MKIDNQYLSDFRYKNPDMHPENFEKWMNPTGENSGQAWYWQHQHHLQPSSLTFTSHIENSTFFTCKIKNNNYSRSKLIHTKNLHKENSKSEIEMRKTSQKLYTDIAKPLPITSIDKNPSLLATIKKLYKKNQLILDKNHKKMNKTSQKFKINLFKKQRIHIKDNELDCSMNLEGISHKPTKNIVEQLKKWLISQRIKIKKIRINGVLQ